MLNVFDSADDSVTFHQYHPTSQRCEKGQANQNKYEQYTKRSNQKTGMNSTPKVQANQNRYEQYTERSS